MIHQKMAERRGGNGGWIPIVHQRRGGFFQNNEARNGLFTVFVDYLPGSMDAKSLFKLFSKFGIVKDVFIPSKRRKMTNSRFGFVRFDCRVASDIAVQKANGLLVDDRVLEVKHATYVRRTMDVHGRGRSQPFRGAAEDFRSKGKTPFVGHRSYAEVLQGAPTNTAGSASFTITVNEDGHGWLYESVIIRLNAEYSINSIRDALKRNGLPQVIVREGGGRDAILTFASKAELKSNIHNIKNWFKGWSQFVLEWRPGVQLVQERCVWLRCQGIPLNLWNRNTLHGIGNLWGTVLNLEGDSCQSNSFSYSRIRVVTTSMELINKTIHLECKGTRHPILVCEEFPINPQESSSRVRYGTADCSSIAGHCEVKEARSAEVNCKRKEDDDDVAVGGVISPAVITSSNEVALSNGPIHCNNREEVDTVVEESMCGVQLSRPSAVGVQEVMMQELVPCLKSHDGSLRCVEQASSSGFLKSLSGPLDRLGPGINLEVDLGHPLEVQPIVNSWTLPAISQINRPSCSSPPGCISFGPSNSSGSHIIGVPDSRLGKGIQDQRQASSSVTIPNRLRPVKKPGHRKALMEGFSRFARLHGRKAAALAKLSSKSVIFRPAVAAIAHCPNLSEGVSSSHSLQSFELCLVLSRLFSLLFSSLLVGFSPTGALSFL